MKNNRYHAVEIVDEQIKHSEVEHDPKAVAEYILNCRRESIITLYTKEGELFLVGMGQKILECRDKTFWQDELRPCLIKKGMKV